MFNQLIWSKKNALPKSFCDSVIKKYDQDLRKVDSLISAGLVCDKSVRDSTNLSITGLEDWKEEDDQFYNSLKDGLSEYIDYLLSVDETIAPIRHNLEIQDDGYTIIKYKPQGYYNWHSDWNIFNIGSRIISYMWYLNTIDAKDDGYTEFIDKTRVQPECGTLLFFPATWTYVHRGMAPKVDKYICNGWIHAKSSIDDSIEK